LIVNQAGELARQSGKKRAEEVAHLLGEAKLALPILGHGLWYDEKSDRSTTFVAPIVGSDSLLPSSDEYVREFSQPAEFGRVSGMYLPSTRTIYFSLDWPVSRFWTALLLLHEGAHALDHTTGRCAGLRLWEQEVRARRVECSVLSGLYGQRLDSVVEEMLPAIESAISRRELEEFSLPLSVDVILARMFGEPISRYDLDEQREAARRLAVSRYLRRSKHVPDLWRQSVPEGKAAACGEKPRIVASQ
jgi:hypothetical protein